MSQRPPARRSAPLPPPPPPVPPDVAAASANSAYQQMLHVGATAVANAMAEQQNVRPAANMLNLLDANARKIAIHFAKVVIDAVSRHGVAKAQAAGALEQKQTREQEILASVCTECGKEVEHAERSDKTKVVHVVYNCGAEKLAFDDGQWTDRIECPTMRFHFKGDVHAV